MPKTGGGKTSAKKSTVKRLKAVMPDEVLIQRPSAKPSIIGPNLFVKLPKDFISQENIDFKYSLGTVVASSFSGFVAGIVVTSLIWLVIVNFLYGQ